MLSAIWYFKTKSNLRVHSHPSAIFRRWHHQYLLNSDTAAWRVALKKNIHVTQIWLPLCGVQLITFTCTQRNCCFKYLFLLACKHQQMLYSLRCLWWLPRIKIDGNAKHWAAKATVVWEAGYISIYGMRKLEFALCFFHISIKFWEYLIQYGKPS